MAGRPESPRAGSPHGQNHEGKEDPMQIAIRLTAPLLLLALSAGAQVLYEETFSNGTADLAWQSAWGEEADQVLVDWMDGNPGGDGFIGKLGNGLSGGGVGTAAVSAPELVDYRVEAQIHLVPGEAHYRGIVGRLSGSNETADLSFYAFVADLSEGTGMGDQRFMLRYWPVGGGVMTTIRIWEAAELGELYPDAPGWYKLGLEMDGDQLTCFIDDQPLPGGAITDDNVAAGGFGVYFWHFTDFDDFIRFDDVVAAEPGTATPRIAESLPQPLALRLGEPWPNPFNPAVSLPLRLAAAGTLELTIHDLLGRTVRTLAAGTLPAGEHRLVWDGTDAAGRPLASGVYFARLQTAGHLESRRLLLVR
jgi:hypothetical protein